MLVHHSLSYPVIWSRPLHAPAQQNKQYKETLSISFNQLSPCLFLHVVERRMYPAIWQYQLYGTWPDIRSFRHTRRLYQKYPKWYRTWNFKSCLEASRNKLVETRQTGAQWTIAGGQGLASNGETFGVMSFELQTRAQGKDGLLPQAKTFSWCNLSSCLREMRNNRLHVK